MTAVINKLKDKQNVQQLPVTHERAVRDSEGTTLETKLQNLEGAMDKAYVASSDNGMGRITLHKNMVSGVNTLTQSMMQATNTIYVIRYDFTLGEDITVPANCILEFDGGSISANGSNDTITGNNTGINAGLVKIFNTDVTLSGTWNVADVYSNWFDVYTNSLKKVFAFANMANAFNVFVNGNHNVECFADHESAIEITSSMNVYFNGTIKMLPNNLQAYHIIGIYNISDVNIIGGNFIGDLNEHTGTLGEWGTGIEVGNGCSNISIKGCNISNCWGDGIYVSSSTNVLIDNVKIDRTRRNGISITDDVKNIKITNFDITNIYGTDPQAAIDVEPNTAYSENIIIENGIIEGCLIGIYLQSTSQSYNTRCKNVKITNIKINSSYKSGHIIIASTVKADISDCILISGETTHPTELYQQLVRIAAVDNINITNCEFLGNNAIDAVNSTSSKSVEINHCWFECGSIGTLSGGNYSINNCYIKCYGSRLLTYNEYNKYISLNNSTIYSYSNSALFLKDINFTNVLIRKETYAPDSGESGTRAIITENVVLKNSIVSIASVVNTKYLIFNNSNTRIDDVYFSADSSKNYDGFICSTDGIIKVGRFTIQNTISYTEFGYGVSQISYDNFTCNYNSNGRAFRFNQMSMMPNAFYGFRFFFQDSKKNAFWNGTRWDEFDGAALDVKRNGTFADKPSASNIFVGFRYFCTDRQTTEGATDGIEIIHKGNNVWVDALGRVVS